MKNIRNRILAVLVSAAAAVSLTVPALAGSGEAAVSFAQAETAGSNVTEDGSMEIPDNAEAAAVTGEALTAVPAGPGTEEGIEAATEAGTEVIVPETGLSEETEDPAGADSISAESETAAGREGTEQYIVRIRESEGGSIFFFNEEKAVLEKTFQPGEKVLLCAWPDEGYRTERIRLVYPDGTETELRYAEEKEYWEGTLTAGAAEAEASFVKVPDAAEQED